MQALAEAAAPSARLSSAQQEAVDTPGNMAIFACPGSGKTHTLATKAAMLLDSRKDIRLCAVTFTNESVSELRERIHRYAPMAGKRLMVGTFHSLCLDQLKANGQRRIALLSPFEQSALVREAWRKAAPSSKLEDVVREIEHGKSTLMPRVENVDSNPLEAAFQYYQERLERAGKLDFADIIRNVVLGMREREVSPLDIHVLLVDEFQDADEVQLEWVALHARDGVEVTVVGDDDQSLYGWRHALGYAGMMRFMQQCHARLIRLDTCYRCAPLILGHARSLIEFNPDRQPKALLAAKDSHGEVIVRAFATDTDQSDAIYAQLKNPNGTWAILGRTNVHLDAIDALLAANEVPYNRVGGKKFWDGKWPSTYLSVLRSLATGDRLGVDILVGQMGLNEATIHVYKQHLPRRGKKNNLDSLLANPPPLDNVHQGDAAVLRAWFEKLGSWIGQARGSRPNLVLVDVAEHLARLLGGASAHTVLEICSTALSRINGSLAQRLHRLRMAQNETRPVNAAIQLMTLHTAKGLEFDNVWMINVEEETLPHKKGDLCEERRLAYVGMTRARERLVMSYRRYRTTEGGEVLKLVPSRFIMEAGLEMPS